MLVPKGTWPAWPAMMRRSTAAAYLDMSEGAFEREIFNGRLPEGVQFGGRIYWHRDAIDKALMAITGGEAVDDWRSRSGLYGTKK